MKAFIKTFEVAQISVKKKIIIIKLILILIQLPEMHVAGRVKTVWDKCYKINEIKNMN